MVKIRGKAILNLDRSSHYVQLYHSCQNAKNKALEDALVTNDDESKGLPGMMACQESETLAEIIESGLLSTTELFQN